MPSFPLATASMSMGNLARQSGSGEYVSGTRLGMADQVQSQRQLETDLDNTLKLIYGCNISIRNMVTKLTDTNSESNSDTMADVGNGMGKVVDCFGYSTSTYKSFYYAAPSGFKIVLLVSKITAAGGAGGGSYPQSLGGTGAMTNPTIPSMGVRGGSASIDSSLSPSATPTTFSTVQTGALASGSLSGTTTGSGTGTTAATTTTPTNTGVGMAKGKGRQNKAISFQDAKRILRHVYSNLFVEYVVKNPMYKSANSSSKDRNNQVIGDNLTSCPKFSTELGAYLNSQLVS